MRVKVECSVPLPPLKIWFVVPAVSTITELKYALWQELPGLHQVSTDDLVLLLDGFELTDSSAIDVIRDGELITVKQNLVTSAKRKNVEEPALPSAKRVKRASQLQLALAPPGPSTHCSQKNGEPSTRSSGIVNLAHEADSSSSSQTSDSESDSSDDSDSSTDSSESDSDSSDDDSSSSSDSSSAPSERPSKPTVHQKANNIPAQREQTVSEKTAPATFVPPGQGKAVTQSRNARRRRKKAYERLASQAEPASANDIPLGPRQSVHSEYPVPGPSNPTTVVPTIMMASLSNKNKRKGFKQAMANALPKKIVFGEPEVVDASVAEQAPLPFTAAPVAEVKAAAPNIFPRLVPPSEKQENGQLPPNMKKDKKKIPPPVPRRETLEVEDLVLDYGEADDHIPTQREPAPSVDQDWAKVETNWENYAKIKDVAQVAVGNTVAWKALGINPATFTPEWLLNVGKLITVGDIFTVKPIYKPGEVAFDDLEEDEQMEVLYDEETYDWNADVLGGDWRVIA